jgi:molecular chaperone IbpA
MRTYDLSPLFRSTVGFDRWSDLFDAAFAATEEAGGFPPYNIEKLGEDDYRIVMAVAGFADQDLTITAQNNLLVIAGRRAEAADGGKVQFLHRGIATRAFERKFNLADYMVVDGADLADGILTVKLRREVPDSLKPRSVPINGRPADLRIIDRKAS